MKRLEGKTAVVTGASSGIGKAIAIGLGGEGCTVAVNYRSNARGALDTVSAIERQGGRARAIRADVGNPDDVKALLEEAGRLGGHVDVLVNNAGITLKGSFEDVTPRDWEGLVATDLSGMVYCSQAVLPLMPDGGAILNISSIHAVRTTFRFSVYAAVKGGVEAFTRSLALELSPRHIRVNALRPGWIQVERDRIEPSSETYRRACERIPLGRPGEVEDLIPAAILLCTRDGAYITGQILGVDGGQEIALNAPYPSGFETGAGSR